MDFGVLVLILSEYKTPLQFLSGPCPLSFQLQVINKYVEHNSNILFYYIV